MSWTVAIGVDTHKDVHVAVACDRLGAQVGTHSEPASAAGYLSLWRWARSLGEPAFAVEGSGSYGAGLVRVLLAVGAQVFECERPQRRQRGRGKSDLIDAAIAARRLVSGERLARVRGQGAREDLRLLLLEQRSAVQARTSAINQLRAVLVTAPEPLRQRLEHLPAAKLAAACACLRASVTTTGVLKRLGQRVRRLEHERQLVDRQLEQFVRELAPQLLDEPGIGPHSAAQLLVSSGDPTRMRSEAAFAALAGTSPVDASSGKQQRHRLNRGGDRQLNRALHTIAVNRIRHHQPTRDYHARLTARGKTPREARRCIKRALARNLYPHLTAITTT